MNSKHIPVYDAIHAKLAVTSINPYKLSKEELALAARQDVLHEVNHQRSLLGYAPIDLVAVPCIEVHNLKHKYYIAQLAHAGVDLVFDKMR